MPSCPLVDLERNLHGLIKISVLDVYRCTIFAERLRWISWLSTSAASFDTAIAREFPRCDVNFGRLMELVKNTHPRWTVSARWRRLTWFPSTCAKSELLVTLAYWISRLRALLSGFSRYISEFHSSTGSLKGRLLVLQYPLVDS